MQVRVTFPYVCRAQGCLPGLPFLSSSALAGIKRLAEESGLAGGKLKFPSWSTVRTWGFTMVGGVCDE